MGNYIDNLINQFVSAKNIKNVDKSSKEFVSEFIDWIKERQAMGKVYTTFLDDLGFLFETKECAEVNKGEFDSVVKPFDTTIITQDSISDVDSSRIIKGKMMVLDSMPVLIGKNKDNGIIRPVPNKSIRTFMTQNPFPDDFIIDWHNLHNSGKRGIILGAYGSINDKDIEKKLKELRKLRRRLTEYDYFEDYTVSDSAYYYAIGSAKAKRKYKELILTREKEKKEEFVQYLPKFY